MSPVARNRVVLSADIATRADVIAASRRLAEEGFELVVVGPGAPAAALALGLEGIAAQVQLGDPAACLADPVPAVAVFGASPCSGAQDVPNRVCLQPQISSPSSPHPGCQPVACLDAWTQDYLAPRVPRLCLQRTQP